MTTEQRTTDAKGLRDLYQRAWRILVTPEIRQLYPNSLASTGMIVGDVLGMRPIKPLPPTTRKDATPHLLLVGPFKNEPELLGVDVYAGIGFIEVRKHGSRYSCGLGAIEGADQEARVSYLETAIDLYNSYVNAAQGACP